MQQITDKWNSALSANNLDNLRQLANKADVGYNTVRDFALKGRTPRGDTLLKIAKALNTTVEFLLTGDESATPPLLLGGEEQQPSKGVMAAVEVIRHESRALANLEEMVKGQAFARTIELIQECAGAVVILGMGKSAIVAQKMVATFISTGTQARYLHAGDALHGDLGAIGKDDLVIAISKSGETRETLLLLPFMAKQGNKVVAITNDADSSLAKGSDVALLLGVEAEACPLNLAPMTSTTATMAIGDALAAALIVANNFGPHDFARFHPGGKLGWSLTATVADMIDSSQNPRLPASATLQEVVVSLVESRMGGVSIIDSHGALAGVITDGDLKRVVLDEPEAWQRRKADEIMKRNPVTVTLATSAVDALELMERRERQISVLPVVDDEGRPVGMLRLHDVIRTHL